MDIFVLNNVGMTFGEGEAAVQALKDVSFSVKEKDKISIVGASGSGKSTLLNVLSGLQRPSAGSVMYSGEDLYDRKDKYLSDLRLRDFGFVFQSFYLISSMTVRDNILFPAVMEENPEGDELFSELVADLNLEHRLDHYPTQLSGGEKQRVAIARALINRPKVVFADEPSGNLDSANGTAVFDMLFRMADKYGQTLIYVTHDNEKAALADRIITIKDGALI